MRLILPFAVLAMIPTALPADNEAGFVPLFNGKGLTGWTMVAKPNPDGTPGDPSKTWSVVDGYIRCTGKPNGYLATTKEYSDYVLRLKWRFPVGSPGGNSGVLLHVQKEDKYWPDSVEAQLKSGSAGDIWLIMPPQTQLDVDPARRDPKQPRHYFRINKDEVIEKPFGAWNEYEIMCKGGDVTLVVNGKKVNEGKNGNWRSGRIALQSEGAEVHFRDIEIKPLK